MKLKILSPLLLVVSLSSCTQNAPIIVTDRPYFNTLISYTLYQGDETTKNDVESILDTYDKLSNNYQTRSGVVNVSNINMTNEDITISSELYNLLKSSFSYEEVDANNFNPLCGSLAKAWKEALGKNTLLSEEVINAELEKMNNSSLIFKDNNVVQRIGEAEIDLGAVAKGYVLDELESYFKAHDISQYLVNAGYSSILLGEKNTSDGLFTVRIDPRIVNNSYLKMKNCFISTSSITEQGVKIGDKTYSHIINPHNGSALNEQDAVIVISSKGYVGDILSTSLMMNTLDEIKEIEAKQDIKCIVVKNGVITYHHPSIEVTHR